MSIYEEYEKMKIHLSLYPHSREPCEQCGFENSPKIFRPISERKIANVLLSDYYDRQYFDIFRSNIFYEQIENIKKIVFQEQTKMSRLIRKIVFENTKIKNSDIKFEIYDLPVNRYTIEMMKKFHGLYLLFQFKPNDTITEEQEKEIIDMENFIPNIDILTNLFTFKPYLFKISETILRKYISYSYISGAKDIIKIIFSINHPNTLSLYKAIKTRIFEETMYKVENPSYAELRKDFLTELISTLSKNRNLIMSEIELDNEVNVLYKVYEIFDGFEEYNNLKFLFHTKCWEEIDG